MQDDTGSTTNVHFCTSFFFKRKLQSLSVLALYRAVPLGLPDGTEYVFFFNLPISPLSFKLDCELLERKGHTRLYSTSDQSGILLGLDSY